LKLPNKLALNIIANSAGESIGFFGYLAHGGRHRCRLVKSLNVRTAARATRISNQGLGLPIIGAPTTTLRATSATVTVAGARIGEFGEHWR
jgi:hypothetical protein